MYIVHILLIYLTLTVVDFSAFFIVFLAIRITTKLRSQKLLKHIVEWYKVTVLFHL